MEAFSPSSKFSRVLELLREQDSAAKQQQERITSLVLKLQERDEAIATLAREYDNSQRTISEMRRTLEAVCESVAGLKTDTTKLQVIVGGTKDTVADMIDKERKEARNEMKVALSDLRSEVTHSFSDLKTEIESWRRVSLEERAAAVRSQQDVLHGLHGQIEEHKKTLEEKIAWDCERSTEASTNFCRSQTQALVAELSTVKKDLLDEFNGRIQSVLESLGGSITRSEAVDKIEGLRLETSSALEKLRRESTEELKTASSHLSAAISANQHALDTSRQDASTRLHKLEKHLDRYKEQRTKDMEKTDQSISHLTRALERLEKDVIEEFLAAERSRGELSEVGKRLQVYERRLDDIGILTRSTAEGLAVTRASVEALPQGEAARMLTDHVHDARNDAAAAKLRIEELVSQHRSLEDRLHRLLTDMSGRMDELDLSIRRNVEQTARGAEAQENLQRKIREAKMTAQRAEENSKRTAMHFVTAAEPSLEAAKRAEVDIDRCKRDVAVLRSELIRATTPPREAYSSALNTSVPHTPTPRYASPPPHPHSAPPPRYSPRATPASDSPNPRLDYLLSELRNHYTSIGGYHER